MLKRSEIASLKATCIKTSQSLGDTNPRNEQGEYPNILMTVNGKQGHG